MVSVNMGRIVGLQKGMSEYGSLEAERLLAIKELWIRNRLDYG